MELYFKNNKLRKALESERAGNEEWGPQNAAKIRQRVNQLRAAQTLAQISHLPPPRLHELDGGREGQFAVDAKHPFRVVFKPEHEPVPKLADGGIDRTNVTAIRILEVEDYHGKQKR